jgi:hypothetical protein
MLSKKLLLSIGVDMLAGKNSFRWRKSAAQSARIASFRPLAITSGQAVIYELFHLKNEALTGSGTLSAAEADGGQ